MHPSIAILPSRDGQTLGCRSVGSGVLESSVARLVGAVYEAYRGEAHRLLRNRIHTDANDTEIDRAVVRVAAGKLTTGTVFEAGVFDTVCWLDECADGLDRHYATTSELTTDGLSGSPFALAVHLDERVRALPRDPERKRAEQDRPLAAALLDAQGTVLLAARNTAGLNKTRHAEVNLLSLARIKGRLPFEAGMQVITTLSPCKMCAALVLHAFEDLDAIRVAFLERDPGKLARHTVLDDRLKELQEESSR